MAGIVILCVILLLLGLILFTPILVRVIREEEGLLVRLHVGPVKLQVYPPKEEAQQPLEEKRSPRRRKPKQNRRNSESRSQKSRSCTW